MMALISLWMSWAFDKECPFAQQQGPDIGVILVLKFIPTGHHFAAILAIIGVKML